MRLGGRLAAAIEVLEDIERRHRPTADALKDWGLSHRFAGAGDRGAIGNIVYDALRRKRSASWLFDDDSPRSLGFGALLLEWKETPDGLNRAVEGDRFAPEPLSAAEHGTASARLRKQPPEEVRADCPDWCVPLLRETFGDAWPEEAAALASRPPLDLRVNTLLSNREKVLAELEETGASASPLAPQGIRIAPIDGGGRHPNVQAEPAFQQGWFEIQDEGSQIAAELAGVEPGMKVLDYCAGGGGKTLSLAAAMNNTGTIYAHDSEKQRLAPIFDRLRRAGAANVEVVARAASLEPLAGALDAVLIDAPCTGTGTWRRRPDAKWRLTQRQLDQRVREQAAILDQASRFVKPGGRLVYITCSVFRDENHGQVERFLAAHPEFTPLDHAAHFEKYFPGKTTMARIEKDRGIILSPLLSGTDGFFFAGLVRD
jgi:16S rRNA (cytosine967-C5)-methyltransferase